MRHRNRRGLWRLTLIQQESLGQGRSRVCYTRCARAIRRLRRTCRLASTQELRALAATRLAHAAPGQTLPATVLVPEAWLRLAGGNGQSFPDRANFLAEFCVGLTHEEAAEVLGVSVATVERSWRLRVPGCLVTLSAAKAPIPRFLRLR